MNKKVNCASSQIILLLKNFFLIQCIKLKNYCLKSVSINSPFIKIHISILSPEKNLDRNFRGYKFIKIYKI
jgi:hypothetical protein